MYTVNDAAKQTTCFKCKSRLEFVRLGDNAMWRVGMCQSCGTMPAFCSNCQKWFMVEYISNNTSHDWSCPSCGDDDLNNVTACTQ